MPIINTVAAAIVVIEGFDIFLHGDKLVRYERRLFLLGIVRRVVRRFCPINGVIHWRLLFR